MDTSVYTPPADIFELDDAYLILIDVPGVREEQVEIELDRNILTVSAKRTGDEETGEEGVYREYRTGEYRRSFTLGTGVDREDVSASIKDGVLTLRLPKSKEVMPRRIAISRS